MIIFCSNALCFAKDKSGVSPNTVSLPSGPGSIEGLGESFQPLLNTGTARYAVSISLPSGTLGHAPTLKLQYDSGLGFSRIAPGWVYGPGSISRRVDKGIPRYVDGVNGVDDDGDSIIDEVDEADVFIGPDGEELVPMGNGEYRARIESAFALFRHTEQGWLVDLKNGTKLEFGGSSSSRISSTDGERVYRWLLTKSTDVNGNTIEYSWVSLAGSDNNKYLKEIRYGPRASPWSVFYFVSFTYELRPDWRKDYRSGFQVRFGHRLSEVHSGIQGNAPAQCAVGDWNKDTVPDSLINRYQLTYDQISPGTQQLVKVTRFGSDGVTPFPPIRFRYSSALPAHSLSAAQAVITSLNSPLAVMDSQLVDLIDLNRDGLPDILKTDSYGSNHLAYVNMGETVENDHSAIKWSTAYEMNSSDQLAVELHLVEDSVSLADMNGDGLADLVHNSTVNEVFYYANTGDLSWASRTPMSIQDTAPPAPFAFDNVKTADVDFNKRMDVVRSTENSYSIWLNYQDGIYSREIVSPGARYLGRVISLSDSGVDFADINGDRISDVVQVTPSSVVYCAGLGYGQYANGIAVAIPDQVLTDGANSQVTRAKLTDINGDGLADLVLERASVNELWFWLNLGTDTFSDRYVLTDMPTQYGSNTVVRWADMNGNGSTDLVYADSSAVDKLRIIDLGRLISGSAHPNLLTGINNGLGRVTTITYASSTEQALQDAVYGEPWMTTIPFPVQVVSKIEVSSGVDMDMLPGIDSYTKTIVYRDGFYEDREHQFRGFAEVTVTEPGDSTVPGVVTTSEFFTGGPDGIDNDGDGSADEVSTDNHREEEALKGMVKALETRDENGRRFVRDETFWEVRTLPLPNPGNIEIRLALSKESRKLIYEGDNTPEIIRSTRIYDDFGNVISENNYGALSLSGDEVFTTTEYINDTERWLLGFPYHSLVTDADGNRAAETKSYYDGEDFVGLASGSLTKGRLSRQQAWVDGDVWIDSARSSYDSYGNITAVLDPNGSRRTLTWDPVLFTYPVREDIETGTNKPDLAVTASYNYGLGTMVSSLDFNGHTSSYFYDIFGRPTSFVLPGDTSQFPTQRFSYLLCDPVEHLLYSYDDTGQLDLTASDCSYSQVVSSAREVIGEPGTLDTKQFVDGMGRKIFSLSEGESDYIVQEQVLFNARGSVRYAFLPHRATEDEVGNRPDLSLPHLENIYDGIGREVQRISPLDEYGVRESTGVSYHPLSVTTTDERGSVKITYQDGLDRLLSVREQNGVETYITHYGYDTTSNLVSIVDNQNNVKTISYDGLGRKSFMADPDRGKMEYWYDAASNLIRTRDNKNQEILYSYDRAGRLLSEDYLDAAAITPDVRYNYDQPDSDYPDAQNLLGRLASVHDLSGAQFFSFDSRGNSEWSIIRIRDGDKKADFRSAAEFDALGRITASIYPDGDRVEYHYNNRGLLDAIPGFLDNLDYHVSGSMQLIQYANGITSSLLHDPHHRLIQTTTSPQNGDILQNLHYSFDPVGNITAIADLRPIAAELPENAGQNFQYDDLNRLVHAEGAGYGAISCQYDSIGNMLYKSSPDEGEPQHIDDPLINLREILYGALSGNSNRGERLPGDDPGPHAVTSTQSGLSYQYDDNGNVVNRNGDVYFWDFADRLLRAETADSITDYIYNAAGQRVIKKVDTNGTVQSTWYVSEGYEIREGKTEKYIFADSKRVAKVSGRLTAVNADTTQILHLQSGINFISVEMEVPAEELYSTLDPEDEVWTWDSSSRQYLGYIPAANRRDFTELIPGQGYIIRMVNPHTLYLSGNRTVPHFSLVAGWNLVGCLADRELTMEETIAAAGDNLGAVWEYDPSTGKWRNFMSAEPSFLSNLAVMRPGHAYWLKVEESAEVSLLQTPLTKSFFHPDHLGSSSLVTDETGSVVERTEYYPFGRPRYEFRGGFDSPYKYTDKELDKETGLMYYEARYYDAVVGRFVSVDPYLAEKTKKYQPYKLNLYMYAADNPILHTDSYGLEDGEEETSVNWELLGKGAATFAGGGITAFASVSALTALGAAVPASGGISLLAAALPVSGLVGGVSTLGLGMTEIITALNPGTAEQNKRQVEQAKTAEKVVKAAALDPAAVTGFVGEQGALVCGADKETADLVGEFGGFSAGMLLSVNGKISAYKNVRSSLEGAGDAAIDAGGAILTLMDSGLEAASFAQNVGNIVDKSAKRSNAQRQRARSKQSMMSSMPRDNDVLMSVSPGNECGVIQSCAQ